MTRLWKVLVYVLGLIPTFLVFAGLGALGYWGHQTGWKVPAFSSLSASAAAPEEKEDWCQAHNVPASRCIACNPELAGENPADWCKEHGVPESKCTTCHPELLTTGKIKDWCIEHGLPESQCTICHPEIAVKGELPVDPDAPKVITPANADPTHCQTYAMRVQFASAASVTKAGIHLTAVREMPFTEFVSTNAEVAYDQSRLARVSSRVPGVVVLVLKQLGDAVSKDELIAVVDAPEVGRLKAELIDAITAVEVKNAEIERIRAISQSGIVPRREMEDLQFALRLAESRRENARQALRNLGFEIDATTLAKAPADELQKNVQAAGIPQAAAKALGAKATNSNLIPIFAPENGIVCAKDVVAGEVVEQSKPLFTIADLSRFWIECAVPIEESALVCVGLPMTFRADGLADEPVAGRIFWTGSEISEKTRTLQVKAEVANPRIPLRVHTFGTANIKIRQKPKAIMISTEAIHWEGCCHVVFVRLADDIFQTRKVKLGSKSGLYAEVLNGLVPGEVVAEKGSHVLLSEILKSKLGAGCCDGD
jgi:cobalt-zinc-cadmium efflux system membrane fusion protein